MVRIIFLGLLSSLLLFMAGVSLSQFRTTRTLRLHHDSQTYLDVARCSPLSREFWCGSRPPVYPLFIAVMGYDLGRVAKGQLVLSAISWSFLALGVFCTARTYLSGLAGAALILIFSLSPDIVGMYKVILTESLSFSFLAGMCGAALLFLKSFKSRWLFLVSGYACLYALVRDSNAYLVLLIGIVALSVSLYFVGTRALQGRLAVASLSASGLMIALFFVADASSNVGKRWLFPFYNNVSATILPFPSRVSWFQDRGMPVSKALMKRAGKWVSGDRWAYYQDPELASFREWATENGKTTYMRWLLARPGYLIVAPLKQDGLKIIAYCSLMSYAPGDYRPLRLLPSNIDGSNYLVWAFVAGCLLSTSLGKGLGNTRGRMVFPIVLLGLSIPHFLVVWHGDPMELGRHCAQVNMQIRLSVITGVALSLDYVGGIVAMLVADTMPNKVLHTYFQKAAHDLLKNGEH